MRHLIYYWSKLLKKIRFSAIYNSSISVTAKIESGSHIVNSIFGRYSFCGYDCQIINCTIGSFCSIADNVKIGGARHPMEWVSTSPVFYAGHDSVTKKFATFKRSEDKYTTIGSDVWIGANAIIIQGVCIGHGAVIAAGAVVTKDVNPYEIVGGNPAKLIRKRFDDNTIGELLASEWWELPDDRIQVLAQYIQEPAQFIKHIIR